MRPLALAATICFLASATAALAASDRDFLKKAMEGDNSETRLGMIAEQRGASPGVRDFGRMLQMDHTKAKQQAMPVAQQLGVRPTDEMQPAARQEERKLGKLSGRRFDEEFARYMVKDHKQDIKDFEREASKGASPAVRSLAQQSVPVLQKHLDTAEHLQQTL